MIDVKQHQYDALYYVPPTSYTPGVLPGHYKGHITIQRYTNVTNARCARMSGDMLAFFEYLDETGAMHSSVLDASYLFDSMSAALKYVESIGF